MWCRAILTITLLACTFQRTNGQSYDTKDLLCVLVLSGLQKEDLDIALLRKLQRHNVNFDDLDNVDIRNECNLNANKSDDNTNDIQKPMRSQFEANNNKSEKVMDQNNEVNSNKEKENITKLMKLIGNRTPEMKVDSSITPELNLHSIKDVTTTTSLVKLLKPHIKSQPNSITYINKVLQQFIAQASTTTSTTTTTPTTSVDLRSILYEIKNMLANKSVNRREDSTESKNEQEYNQVEAVNDRIINKKKGMRRRKENVDYDQYQKVSNERSTEDKFYYTKAVNDRIINKNKGTRRRKESVELVDQSQEFSNERPTEVKLYTKTVNDKIINKNKGMRRRKENVDIDQYQLISNERPTEVKFYTKTVNDRIINKNKGTRRRKENCELVDQSQEFSNERPTEVKVYTKAANGRIINKKKGMRRRKENVELVDQSQEVSNEQLTKVKPYTKAVDDRIINKNKGTRRRTENDALVDQSQEVSNERPTKVKAYTKAVNDRIINKKRGTRRRKENVEWTDRSQEISNEQPTEVEAYTKAVNNRIVNKNKSASRRKENVKLVDHDQSQEVSNQRPTEVEAYTKAVNEVTNEQPIKDDTKLLSPSGGLRTNYTNESEGQIITKKNQPLINENKFQFQDDINIIQGNIIKDIAESVKTILLQDLKKEMSSTISTTTNTKGQSITTKTDIEATTTHEKDIAQIIQLYKNLRNNIIPVVNRNLTRQIQHKAVSIVKVPSTLPTMPNNPYQNPVISHIFNNLQGTNDLTNLNTEMQTLPIYRANSINRIDQVNIFNPKHELQPLTIQTNIGQIPPLSVPMIAPPIKMIYQNIVVTTENSFEHFKSMHKFKSSNTNLQDFLNNNDNQLITKPQPKSFDHPKRIFRVQRMRSPTSYIRHRYNAKQEYANMRHKNREFQKFHEKLEKTNDDDGWYSNEHREKKLRVAPRHLRPLNDNKSNFDDTHFRNFLKTQQKVNNMLERILATKSIGGPRSVEIP